MFTIKLTGIQCFSFHGLHEEEKLLGAQFEVDVSVSFPEQRPITSIEQTIDYVNMHTIIKNRMSIPTSLLETLAQELSQLIFESDKRISAIDISIKKLHPPIPNFKGTVGVSYKKVF
ncbi:MAG: dihydroneopterin aldolase [Ferruginibacter sp.]